MRSWVRFLVWPTVKTTVKELYRQLNHNPIVSHYFLKTRRESESGKKSRKKIQIQTERNPVLPDRKHFFTKRKLKIKLSKAPRFTPLTHSDQIELLGRSLSLWCYFFQTDQNLALFGCLLKSWFLLSKRKNWEQLRKPSIRPFGYFWSY